MPSMFDNMYIPWTPRGIRPLPPTPEPEPKPKPAAAAPKPKQVCVRTLNIARAIINHALQPFPEALYALAAAFLAYDRDELDIAIPDGALP